MAIEAPRVRPAAPEKICLFFFAPLPSAFLSLSSRARLLVDGLFYLAVYFGQNVRPDGGPAYSDV